MWSKIKILLNIIIPIYISVYVSVNNQFNIILYTAAYSIIADRKHLWFLTSLVGKYHFETVQSTQPKLLRRFSMWKTKTLVRTKCCHTNH